MKTIREQIIERIIAQLENITIDNDYTTDIGMGRVYREQPVIEQGNAPAVAVWELAESRERNRYGGTVRTLKIKVEAIVIVNGNKHPATASNEILGDLERALIMEDTGLDQLIDDIQDVAAEISHIPHEKNLAGATIDFEIQYTTEWGDPYNYQ